LILQPVGQFHQGQVVLFLQPTLYLSAGGSIDPRWAACPFPVGLQSPSASMQPQQLLDKRPAHAKEPGHFCL
jgi:hypothetical protein